VAMLNVFVLCLTCSVIGGDVTGAVVLEVGAGPGNLTRALLSNGCKHVIAIEKDTRFVPALQLLQHAVGVERMSIVVCDALDMDEEKLLRDAGAPVTPWTSTAPVTNVQVVGNLPFAVSTELLLKWLRHIPNREGAFRFGRIPMTLLFQLEVAQRLYAPVASPSYGRLSVMSQYCAHVHKRFNISRAAFVPRPDVDTAVVTIVPRIDPQVCVYVCDVYYIFVRLLMIRRCVCVNLLWSMCCVKYLDSVER
jgi:dimethyladenosine transferase 1